MPKIITASKARAELFQLMDDVARPGAEAIVIRRRGQSEGVVLVREGYLKLLEMRASQADIRTAGKPFKLMGSIRVNGDVEESLRKSREEQAQFRNAKFADLPE